MIDDALPIEREFEIAKTLGCNVFDVFLLREQDGLWDRDAELCGECEVEKLVVRRPPERVVDDVRALERKPLERRTVRAEKSLAVSGVYERLKPLGVERATPNN